MEARVGELKKKIGNNDFTEQANNFLTQINNARYNSYYNGGSVQEAINDLTELTKSYKEIISSNENYVANLHLASIESSFFT